MSTTDEETAAEFIKTANERIQATHSQGRAQRPQIDGKITT